MTSHEINIDWDSVDSISDALLKLVPQQDPFRFIDRIIEIDETRVVGQYTYKKNEYFYEGHFPGNPVTPGVIQIETMAQTGVVTFGLYLILKEQRDKGLSLGNEMLTLFTDVEAEFYKSIPPETTVTVKAEKVFWRRNKLRSKVSLYLPNGDLASCATLSGLGVPKQ